MKSNMHKRHRLPRKSRMPMTQRLTAWLLMIMLAAMMLVMIGQGRAEEHAGMVNGQFPEPKYGLQWATVNAWQVNFRQGPGTEYGVVETWSWGVAVEVLGVQDEWAQVLRYTQPVPMWVRTEYLDFVD